MWQKRRQAGHHFFAALVVFAAVEHEGLAGRAFLHHHGARQRAFERFLALLRSRAGHLGPADRAIDVLAIELADRGLLCGRSLFMFHAKPSLHRLGQRDTRDPEHARLVGGKREAKTADGMPLERLLTDADDDAGIFRHRHRLVWKDGEMTGLALVRRLAVDRPALSLLPLEHARRGPAILLVVGLGPLQVDGDRLGIPRRLDLGLDLRDHDVAIAGPTEAAAPGQARIGQHLEPETTEIARRDQGLELIRIAGRLLALDEPGAVLAPPERRAAGASQL